ncbi:MAG: U32 family peptidase [bacterium]
MKKIELLAPARNLECGLAAVLCGADAVYIAAERFGARAGAGNSLGDIERLVSFAHPYRVRVYATVNTILNDSELPEAGELIRRLYEAGVDAVIIQDMGLLELDLPPIPLVASTQTHNTTWQRVLFLERVGFKRVILARELTLEEIREIRRKTSVELECFVHGSLCVSYSGQCYLSYAMGGRSGNRGECAQPCRKAYSLVDAAGKVLAQSRCLLSLKDLNLSEHLRSLIEAGVTSLKIEGRLKDAGYVKNVVSYYRRKLDEVLPLCDAGKSSSGVSSVSFVPNPWKTFNRGYCDYFIEGRKKGVLSPDTQKSTGEPIGRVLRTGRESFAAEGGSVLRSGDGICFFDEGRNLRGTLIKRVSGEDIFPERLEGIRAGTLICRNLDVAFERELRGAREERRIFLRVLLSQSSSGVELAAEDEDGLRAAVTLPRPEEISRDQEKAREQIVSHLSRLGGTEFQAEECRITLNPLPHFSLKALNEARRALVEELRRKRKESYPRKTAVLLKNDFPYPEKQLTFRANVLNSQAESFYRRHGVESLERAAESGLSLRGRTVMTTRHCLKAHFDLCPKLFRKAAVSFEEPLFLVDEKEKKHPLRFDCELCRMEIIF